MLPASPVASTVLVGASLGTLLVVVCVGAFAALVVGLLVARREHEAPKIEVDAAKPDSARARLSA